MKFQTYHPDNEVVTVGKHFSAPAKSKEYLEELVTDSFNR
jgi:hypothetical protein